VSVELKFLMSNLYMFVLCVCSIASVSSLMCEAYRVLKPGGFLLSFSLHPWHSIQEHFFADDLPWSVTPYNIPNARWNEDENVGRAVAHTMVLCVKPDTSGATCGAIDIPGVLTDDEVFVRAKAANEVCNIT
jgi:SAM-dependent methyltransferase